MTPFWTCGVICNSISIWCLLESVPSSILLAACCPVVSGHCLPSVCVPHHQLTTSVSMCLVKQDHTAQHPAAAFHAGGKWACQTAWCLEPTAQEHSGPWPQTRPTGGRKKHKLPLTPSVFKSPAPNPTWGRSVQIPSQSQPTSIMHVSPHCVSTPLPNTMSWSILQPLRGTTSLSRAGHHFVTIASWLFQPLAGSVQPVTS